MLFVVCYMYIKSNKSLGQKYENLNSYTSIVHLFFGISLPSVKRRGLPRKGAGFPCEGADSFFVC